MSISMRDWLQPHGVMSIDITDKDEDWCIINWLHPMHRVKETVIKWTIVSWATVIGINKKNVYPTANTKHTKLVARILQLALPEGAESFLNIKSYALGTRCGVPQPLLGATNARDTEIFEIAVKKNILSDSASELVQYGMKTTNIRINK